MLSGSIWRRGDDERSVSRGFASEEPFELVSSGVLAEGEPSNVRALLEAVTEGEEGVGDRETIPLGMEVRPGCDMECIRVSSVLSIRLSWRKRFSCFLLTGKIHVSYYPRGGHSRH